MLRLYKTVKTYRNLIYCYVVATLTLFSLAFTSCKGENKYRIGVSQCTSDPWRENMNEEILREAMIHDNVEVEIRSAGGDSRKQIEDIEYFAKKKFDIIVASPNEAVALTPIIKKVYENGIPVVLFDRKIKGSSYTAFQGANNYKIGQSAAQLSSSLVDGECRVIEICGLKGSTPAIERHDGFVDVARQDPKLMILGSAYGDWRSDKAAHVTDSMLTLYPKVNLIYAHNDLMAIAASQVAKRRNMDDVKIIGIDAAPNEGIAAVANGIIDATFLYPTDGDSLIITALAVLEGKPYSRNIELPTASAVDAKNAQILLLQNRTMRDGAEKIQLLKDRVDEYWGKYSTQRMLLYSAVLIILLFIVLLYVILRSYWSHHRHHQQLDRQNRELKSQRDELDAMYKQMQDATQSKLSFFTNVSHDLRTPLTLIVDPVEQLSQAENLTERQHMLMQLANKNVKILMRLINQILDFRKSECGLLELNLSEVNLSSYVKEWAEAFHSVTLKRHIKFSTDGIVWEDGFTCAVDIEKFERIFFNLLSNAFKFTPENGVVRIALSHSDSSVTLVVSDTGCGMSIAEQKRIFDRFYQVDKVNPMGSGIGLALVKSFAEMHGGTITVDSAPKKGSTFTVTVPLKHVEVNKAVSTEPSVIKAESVEDLIEVELPEIPVDEKAPTILVIDDNADIRKFLAGLLCDRYTIIQAADGLQGIKLASKYGPDLVVCDVMMPGIDGMETCRRLKSEISTSHIPVMMLTACSMDEQRVAGYECGADAYLSKPFSSQVLIAQCDSLIANRHRVQDALSAEAWQKPADIKADNATVKKKPEAKLTINDNIDNDFYQRFLEVVETEMSNADLSVEDLSSKMGLSRVQFYRKIKALTNYSPAELLRILRLKRADVLLKTTESSVSEICYKVGFSSPSYFTKCYRDYYGEAPTEVQKRTSKIVK